MRPDAGKPCGATNAIPLIVVPCLDEADHIGPLLDQLSREADALGGRIVVTDGGSTDGTRRIVAEMARRDAAISLLENPDRVQSAGINRAVAEDTAGSTHLIRIDAHCRYPKDYCADLMAEMGRSRADSVVVSMIAEGAQGVGAINAAAQNSKAGNGGSSHRARSDGQFVEHGHHALFDLDAFRDVGGYDPAFSHNEDAELDIRLRARGYRIWLAPAPVVTYIPRHSFGALARQYFNHGSGRAKTMLKHRVLPRLRQTKVMMVLPAVLLAALAGLHWAFAVPMAVWLAYCLAAGLREAVLRRDVRLVLVGLSAMLMHLGWSVGFWRQILHGLPLARRRPRKGAAG